MSTETKHSKIMQMINGMGILVLSNLVLKAASFFLLPLYTKYLTPDQLGVTDSITSISSFLFPILVFSFDSAFSAFYYDREDEEYKKKVFNTVFFFVLFTSMVSIGLLIFAKPLSVLLFDTEEYAFAFSISLVSIALNMWYLPFSLVLRIQNRMLSFSIISVVTSLMMILLNIYFVAELQLGYLAMILSTAIVHILQVVLFGFVSRAKIDLRQFDKKLFRRMFKYALPMLPTTISNWILNLSDRYMLLYFKGEFEVGLYGIAFRFNNVINVITNAILTAYTTYAFASKNDDNAKEQYVKVLNAIFIILGFICFIVALFSKEIVVLMTEKSYHSSYKLIGPLLFGKLFYTLSSILGYGFAYAKKSKYFLYPSFIGMVLNVILNIILIPLYGGYAAAITTLIGYGVMMLVTYYLAQKVYPCPYEMKKIIITSAILIFNYTYFDAAALAVKFAIVFISFVLLLVMFQNTMKDIFVLLRMKLKRG